MRIGLANGVWYNGFSAVFAGIGAAMGATATGLPFYAGCASIGLGVFLFVWGITINDRQWWKLTRSSENEESLMSSPKDNTFVGSVHPGLAAGSGNTVVDVADINGNLILNRGGLAIGHGAKADSTSIAIGAGAVSGKENENGRGVGADLVLGDAEITGSHFRGSSLGLKIQGTGGTVVIRNSTAIGGRDGGLHISNSPASDKKDRRE
ncbi:hypothetical protein RN629_01225 [Sphingomonadaceae bacterium jetA1]|jgi:hypothetical protein|uniref:hypothetical protein n=1 Tax=Facivitalis istanbulensis TaxID=3075838 RepID=UPI00348D3A9C